MKRKTKTFDCVEMKNRIQQELWQDYEKRRNEFASYVDYINATSETDPAIRAFRERIALLRTGDR